MLIPNPYLDTPEGFPIKIHNKPKISRKIKDNTSSLNLVDNLSPNNYHIQRT